MELFISISDYSAFIFLNNAQITECVLQELVSLAAELSPGTLEQAKKYTKDPCVHAGKTSASDCIMRLVGKKNLKKLFVATQDKEMRKVFRNMPAVPLIYFKHGIMTLDPPSEATLIKAERVTFI